MDEIERRLFALEMVVIELGPFLDPQALADARRSIEARIEGATAEEADIRRQASSLLEDAQKRFNGWQVG
jgi:uncharacterized protein (DUF2164 family)